MMKRLGAASLKITFSDAEGLLVEHGTDGTVLLRVAPENLQHSDWNTVWDGIRKVEYDSYHRWREANPDKSVDEYLATNQPKTEEA